MKKKKNPWPLWMGIYGFRFVYHGDWADPEIIWHGHTMNINDIQDPMWEQYAEHCRSLGVKTTEDGFVLYCRKNVESMREYARLTIENGSARRVRGIRWNSFLFSKNAPYLAAVPI